MRWLVRAVFVVQAVLAFRVLARLISSSNGVRITPATSEAPPRTVTVIVPVLNEIKRLGPCLDGLIAQGREVAEILVVDGGSTDGTTDLVRRYAERDLRIRVTDASPVPDGVNGKAHGLLTGFARAKSDTEWILTIDADVRPKPGLVPALLQQARREAVDALSAATQQRLSGWGDGLLHPSMLTTLVYRNGIPGDATTDPLRVQANGQCMLIRRESLERIGGFASVLDSICEDVTLARSLAAAGVAVGFYEAGDLIDVEMYADWRETWENWSRSLPMHDRYSGISTAVGLAEVSFVQAAPPWLGHLARVKLGPRHPLTLLNIGLLATRLGVLAGTARAYPGRPWTYWLSPVCDPAVSIRLWLMAARRRHTWRGRSFERGGTT